MSGVLDVSSLVKGYGGLRPLRIERLSLTAHEPTALLGLDQPAAETLVNLLTGASLPDAGEVRIFGRPTSAIRDGDEWLAIVDRFGIVTPRAVLLEGLSALQNLALPFSLEIEPPAADVLEKATALARQVGLAQSDWDRPAGALDGAAQARLRVGRAVALDPRVLLLEHATAGVDPRDVVALAEDVRRTVNARGVAALSLGADPQFAAALATRVLTLEPATGRLVERRRRWFR